MTDPAPSTAAGRGRLLFVAANPSIDRLYELDRLAVGAIQRPRVAVAVPGGKGLNAARAAMALGGAVTAVGIVAGQAGQWIVDRLEVFGVETRMARSTGETRTCVSILDRSTGELTEVYERGEPIEPSAWDALERLIRAELARGDVAAVAVSGSLPQGAPADGYGRIVRIARSLGGAARPVATLVDSYGPTLAGVIGEGPTLVKLNATEAGEATGATVTDAASAVAAAMALRSSGATDVVVTLGAAGAVVVAGDERTLVRPPEIGGVYPVGSGDAFLAGVALALTRGESLAEAARLGVAAGAANALVPGAGVLDPADVEPILALVGSAPL